MSRTALTRHSQAIVTLRCSFPEADIGNGAQHFGGADGGYADFAAAQLLRLIVWFWYFAKVVQGSRNDFQEV